MAIRGSCLCGGVVFEVDELEATFEVCHCSRCRKMTGAASLPAALARKKHYRLLDGADLIQRFEAPLRRRPPAYVSTFCGRCGSVVPFAEKDSDFLEIPAGLFDSDPGVMPDKHIFVEYRPSWDRQSGLPEFTAEEILAHRADRLDSGSP